MNRTPAYQQGFDAGQRGLAFALNPFQDGTDSAREWDAGWQEGAAQVAAYANQRIKAERERAQWLREYETGARDPAIDYSREQGRG